MTTKIQLSTKSADALIPFMTFLFLVTYFFLVQRYNAFQAHFKLFAEFRLNLLRSPYNYATNDGQWLEICRKTEEK